MMRSLLVIGLALAAAYAAPLSEVELVEPRRVSTSAGGSSATAFSTTSTAGQTARDILRRFGFGGSFDGTSNLFPSFHSDCVQRRFVLTDSQQDVLTACQRTNSDTGDTKQCIIDGLPDDSDLKEFLSRDGYDISGISTVGVMIFANGQFEHKQRISFRMCPEDELNDVGTTDGIDNPPAGGAEADNFHTGFPAFPDTSSLFGVRRPLFKFPSIFDRPFFRPIAQGGSGGLFPTFPQIGGTQEGVGGWFPTFPQFDVTDTTDVNYDNCVTKSFDLPKNAFKKAQNCRFGKTPFKQCLREELESIEGAKDLLEFVESEDQQIAGSWFSSSVSSINGVVTRKNKVRLQRCVGAAEQSLAVGGGADSAKEASPAAGGDEKSPAEESPVSPGQTDSETPAVSEQSEENPDAVSADTEDLADGATDTDSSETVVEP